MRSTVVVFALIAAICPSAGIAQGHAHTPGMSHDSAMAVNRLRVTRDSLGALAVADSALAAITRGDVIALTDLMLPEAVLFPSGTRDGKSGYSVRTRAEQRASPLTGITERGFRAEVRVSGPVAVVWYPYDLYVKNVWSHCGADVFVMFQAEGRWRISSLSWSAVQPPACEKHPDGPPATR